MSQRFELLREGLLKAGIAPRHVRRYLGELSDHFDDLVDGEAAKGLTAAQAQAAARIRLGSDEALAAPLLARPELRSYASRYPLAVFGVAPFVTATGIVVCAVWLQVCVVLLGTHFFKLYGWHIEPFGPAAMRARRAFDVWNWLVMYGAPLPIAALFCAIGIKQRVPVSWIALGLAVICIVGGFSEVGIKWSYVPKVPSELNFGFGVIAPFLGESLATCLLRVALNAVLAGGVYWLFLQRLYRHTSIA